MKIYKKHINIGLIFLLILFLFQPLSAEKKIHIIFLNPSSQSDPFWSSVTAFMQEVAHQLNIHLETIYTHRDHIKMISIAKNIVKRKNPPHYLLFSDHKFCAVPIIQAAESSKVKIFLFNNTLIGKYAKEFGKPRQKFKHWIGSLVSDEEQAGYDLACQLFNRSKLNKNKTTNLLVVGGDKATYANVMRIKGLKRALVQYPHIKIKQTIFASWRRDKAQSMARGLLLRYPDIQLVWAANDPMAMGVIDAAEELHKTPGENFFCGGIDWTENAVNAVKSGKLTVTVGGHFMDGGWSLIMLYDYHHGKDFIFDAVTQKMSVMTKDNVYKYVHFFNNKKWQRINFRNFSKVHNPHLIRYDFSLHNVLRNAR